MEVDEGFILGVYNYCDRWCERCSLTSRCRLFADNAKFEAMAAGQLKAVSDAPPHPSDVRETPGWLEELLSEISEETVDKLPDPEPLPAAFTDLVERAHAYRHFVWQWLEANGFTRGDTTNQAVETVAWFSSLIGAKVYRALCGLAEFNGDREYPPDHEGSCKVALLGIDRSIVAWQELVSTGQAKAAEAAPVIETLERLARDLDGLIPGARGFIRPGFDQPDEVARLEAMDWS